MFTESTSVRSYLSSRALETIAPPLPCSNGIFLANVWVAPVRFYFHSCSLDLGLGKGTSMVDVLLVYLASATDMGCSSA